GTAVLEGIDAWAQYFCRRRRSHSRSARGWDALDLGMEYAGATGRREFYDNEPSTTNWNQHGMGSGSRAIRSYHRLAQRRDPLGMGPKRLWSIGSERHENEHSAANSDQHDMASHRGRGWAHCRVARRWHALDVGS